MIITWMLSALLFSGLLAVAAWCAEVALRSSARQSRGVWLAALAAAVTWPVLAPLARRVWPGARLLDVMTVRLPGVRVLSNGSTFSATTSSNLEQFAILVWIVVSLVLLVRLGRALMHLSRLERAAQQRTVDGVTVLMSPTMGPAVVGLVEPRVLLPESVLDLEEPLRRLVLSHEEEHCRAHDQWIIVGSAFVLALFPWNLALWWIARRTRLALEVDCDARVLSRGANAQQYGKLLLFIAQRQPTTAVAPMLAANTSHLERRIIVMCTPLPSRHKARIVAALAGMTIAVAAACSSEVADPMVKPVASSAQARTPTVANEPYFEFQVEKLARSLPGAAGLKYPDVLKAANVEGEVLAQFVVDADGKVEPASFKVLKSDHLLFTQAVLAGVTGMRFEPAEIGGRKVRQVVQMPFTFALSR